MINQNAEIQKIASGIIKECYLDYEGLWGIIMQVEHSDIPFPKSDVRTTVFAIIRRVLQEKDVVVGNFVRIQDVIRFKPWDCSIEEAITRIDTEWNQLGRNPSINEICWFAAKNIFSDNH